MLTCGTKLLHLWTPPQSLCGVAHKKGNLMERIVLQVILFPQCFKKAFIFYLKVVKCNMTCFPIEIELGPISVWSFKSFTK